MPGAPPPAPRGGTAGATPRAVALAMHAVLQRERALDWCVVVVGVIIVVATDRAPVPKGPPYILKASLPDLAHPLLPNTVPAWSVPVLGIVLPAALLALHSLVFRRPTSELHKLLLGLLASVMVAGSITNLLKISVRRPRPDFVPRCWPDMKPVWASEDDFGGRPQCSGQPAVVAEGLKSFPSGACHAHSRPRALLALRARRGAGRGLDGHSSWSAAGLGFLSWALLDLLGPLDGGGHVWRLVLGWLPVMGACAVGVTRATDYWHHPTDIMTGLVLGFFVSWVVYASAPVPGSSIGGGGGSGSGGLGAPGRQAAEDEGSHQPLLLRGGAAGSAAAFANTASAPLPSALLPV